MRALKMHGGGPAVTAGKPLDEAYKSENLDLLGKGMANLERHITNSAKFGVPVVVAVNAFATDSPAELDLVCSASKAAGVDAQLSCARTWSFALHLDKTG